MMYTIGTIIAAVFTAIAITLEVILLGPIALELIRETIADIRARRNQEEE